MELMIHGEKEEAKRACVPNMDGSNSDVRLIEEAEPVSLEQQSVSYLANLKVTYKFRDKT